MTVHRLRSTCRGCGSTEVERFLELGPTPLANSLLRSSEEFVSEETFPLDVYFCLHCGLVQLLDVIDPEILFRDYVYTTGVSETMKAHFRAYAADVADMLSLDGDHLVVEVGSNDGTLLRCFQDLGTRVLGVEPASNIAAMANEGGVETTNVFFSRETGTEVRKTHGPASAILANNVLAHVDDPVGFLKGMVDALEDRGLIVIEVPYLADLIRGLEFDTIYHEHLSYFSVSALARVFEAAGLRLVRVDRVPVHGGSLRLFGGKHQIHSDHSPPVKEMMAQEIRKGLTTLERFERFRHDVEGARAQLLDLLENERRQGKRIAGYGAPAKGNTLLNYCGIGTEFLEFIVDKSPLKVGRLTPGMHIPIWPVEKIREEMPDRMLLLAWNFSREILQQQSEYLERGGSFILPIPVPRVLQGVDDLS